MIQDDNRENTVDHGRRNLLKAAGIATLIGSVPRTSFAGSADWDVIVIGGGFAGVTAARELGRSGMQVLLLEGRDRLGGRTFTGQFAGHRIELGGAWISWAQPYIWAETKRYGLELGESPVNMVERITWVVNGEAKSRSSEEGNKIFQSALDKFGNVDGQNGMIVFPSAIDVTAGPRERLAALDEKSCGDRMKEVALTADEEVMLSAWLMVEIGNDPNAGGLLRHVQWWRLCDNDVFQTNERMLRYQFKDGTAALIQAMIKDSGADVRLGMPVEAVDRGPKGVTVHARGKAFKAGAAVIALPLNVLHTVEFRPPLPAAKVAASKEGHASRLVKVWCKLKERIGYQVGLAPYPHPINFALTEFDDPDGSVVVAGGCGGPGFHVSDRASVQQAMGRMFPGIEVQEVTAHEWHTDPFSRGTAGLPRPRHFSRYFDALQAADVNCFFASTELANGWNGGFMDGAVESGLRAALDVKRALKG